MKFNTNNPYRQRCGREAKMTVNDLTGDYPLGCWIVAENGVPEKWHRHD